MVATPLELLLLLDPPIIRDPRYIPGLQLWLAADRITGLINGDPVTTWSDLSGKGNHVTQATTANKPTYNTNVLNGRPVVTFDGNDWLYCLTPAALLANVAKTIVMVARQSAAATGGVVATRINFGGVDNNLKGWLIGMLYSAPNHRYSYGHTGMGGIDLAYDYPPDVTRTLVVRTGVNGTLGHIRINGDSPTPAADTLAAANAELANGYLGIGQQSGDYLTGHLAEVLMYGRRLTDADCARLERYLRAKWGVP